MAGRKKFTASRRKLETARKDGDVAKSRDITAGCALLAGFLSVLGPIGLLARTTDFLEKCTAPNRDFRTNTMLISVEEALGLAAELCLPFLLIVATAVMFAEISQVGLVLSWSSLRFRGSRLNIFQGLKRIFGINGTAEPALPVDLLLRVLHTGAKIVVLGGTILCSIVVLVSVIYSAAFASVSAVKDVAERLILCAVGKWFIAVFVLGGTDLFVARWKRNERLKMDLQEFKKELRESEGDPEFRGMRKQLHQELLQHGVLAGVRRAKVIVVGKRPASRN